MDNILDFFDSLWNIFLPALMVFIAIALMIILFLLPFMYLQGKANATLLKLQGIEMSWPQAAFAPDNIFLLKNVNVNLNKGK